MICASLFAIFTAASLPVGAAEPKPEIQRAVGAPQAVGVAHTLRTIPEACARLEGQFTGDAANPYKFAAARTSERCQPRARLVDAAGAKASAANGWVLNDVIRVPNAGCASQQAVVRVWRKDAKAVPPKLDAQGRSRIYLKEGLDSARGGDLGPIPVYAAAMKMEGVACK
ncbi:hypothetical protein [Thermomonas sp. HDW16]|uniref:hypothetical protein n=1 Tax=Thermomonas sp. HDW16 TaxID=2714945 RepID=UPI00140B7DC5|nr:hypothetical protein [Thermomonas sp. HDW16]QIL21685.1 hypothetical protein G7079_03400 [Thermomonas sp. HDW16]